MGSSIAGPVPPSLWIETPCIPSQPLSRAAGCNIFLKLENLQPSGSFKSRGIGNMMRRALEERRSDKVHFYCSSGGNAGLACATAATTLGQACTIVVPLSTTAFMVDKLRMLGAEVVQIGEHWAAADRHMREELVAGAIRAAGGDPDGVCCVPPFEHEHVWEGASFLVDEVARQMVSSGGVVDGIVCSVGGGGLLNGIMQGVERNWGSKQQRPPRVVAVETAGADSLNASIKAGELVTLPGITSIATSLGAVQVSPRAFEWSRAKAGEDGLSSVVVSDAEAVTGSIRLANDARLLTEVACGATASVAYNGVLRETLGRGLSDGDWAGKNVVLVVCGGSNVSLEILRKYSETYGVPLAA